MVIIRNKPASALDVERWLRGHGFIGHPHERTWYTRGDDGLRVVLRRTGAATMRVTKISVYAYDRTTGDGWTAHLENPPLWALAALLAGAGESEPALADDEGAVR